MNRRWLVAAIAIATALLVLNETVFVVGEGRQAVVTSFGRPLRVINGSGTHEAGPQFKIPFLQQAAVLDRREMALETPAAEVTSADGRPLEIETLVAWRISDPLAFWRTLSDETTAGDRLSALTATAMASALAPASAADIAARRPDLTAKALAELQARAAAEHLGVEVANLAIRRVNLPAAGVEAADARISRDFQQKAGQIRTQGETDRRQILADADRKAAETIAKANEQAAAVRGSADALATDLYAAAYGKDPDFARFYRTMRAYEAALAQPGATLVLSPDSDFFKYLRLGAKAK
jgi:membrane protease subunit HflC